MQCRVKLPSATHVIDRHNMPKDEEHIRATAVEKSQLVK